MKRTTDLMRACTVALGFFCALVSKSQTIPANFFGGNAWMPDTIGNASACVSAPCVLWGKLHANWQKVKDSKVKLVRFGGIAADKNKPTNYQYIKMIDSIRANGMEPIIQVPYYNGYYSASQAATIVQYINVTKARAVKYWIIGNEPNTSYGYTSASQVAPYIKSFASAMKAVDTTIKIIGPEFAGLNQTITNDLTNPNGSYDITGKDANGRFYIDYFSYHTYPMGNANSILPSRNDVITKLTSFGGFQDELTYLNGRLNSANTAHARSGSSALKAVITEANVDYYNNSADNLYGVGANSFIGGQFLAELYGIGMKKDLAFINIWSTIEGNSVMSNIGFLDGASAARKPLFYHLKMMAENFSGNYINSSDNQTNIKTFACKNSSLTTVMIMNQDASVNYTYTVRLNTSTVSGTSSLKINVDANNTVEYTDVIQNQSTILLTIDQNGNLVKKTVYTLNSEAANSLPPVTYTYTTSNMVTDLAIQAPSLSSNTVSANGNLSLLSTIYNNGSTTAATSNVGYYLSSDTLYNSNDQYLGATSGGTLNAGSGATRQSTVTIPSNASGNYYLLFYADNTNSVAETNENNNIKAVPFTVVINTPTVVLKPDLVISSATVSPGSISAGSKITVTSVIYNSGNTAASSSKTGYYLSTDTLLGSTDKYLGYADGFVLNAGSSATKISYFKTSTKQAGGTYYLLSVADYVQWVDESNEQNNVRYTPFVITGRYSRSSQPDSVAAQMDTVITAIPDVSSETEFKIYPNPSNGKLTVEIPSLNGKETSLHYQVMDFTGKILCEQVITVSQKETVIEIPQGFANGMYILKMTFNGSVVSRNILLVN